MQDTAAQTVKLDADQFAVLQRQVKEVTHSVNTLIMFLNSEGGLTVSASSDVLSVAESNLAKIGKLLGVETESEERILKRHADIRKANLRVRELEEVLGSAQDPAAIQMGIRSLVDRINKWWRMEGFGLVREVHFGEYTCRVKFSCNLFGDFAIIESPTPISDKERRKLWFESLQARGFDIRTIGREKEVIDNEQNRKAIAALIALRLPGSKIVSFENHAKEDVFEMRGFEVVIYDYSHINSLPFPAKQEDE